MPFSAVEAIEIAQRAIFFSVTQADGMYESSPIASAVQVVPPRELSAAEIETVRFVGDYINRRIPSPRNAEQ